MLQARTVVVKTDGLSDTDQKVVMYLPRVTCGIDNIVRTDRPYYIIYACEYRRRGYLCLTINTMYMCNKPKREFPTS